MLSIIIADDKHESRFLLDSFLKKEGYQTYTAANGRQALAILEKSPIDLIISDILMPEMDGYMLCRAIKSDPRWSRIPLIFYTATFTSRQDEIFAIKLGANRFIRKPAEPQVLLDAIRDVLETGKEGGIEPAVYKFKDENDVFKVYNERIIKKLEEKVTELEDSEKSLRESEERYRSIFDNSQVAILLTEPNGAILDVNEYACRLFGYTKEEICKLGRNGIVDLSDPRLPVLLEERRKKGLAAGQLTFKTADGRKFEGEVFSKIFTEKEGKEKTSMLIQDITDRMKAEEALRNSQQQFQSYFNSSAVGLSVTTTDKKWIEVNQHLCDLLGYTKEELLGRTWDELTHPDDIAANLNLFQRALDGEIDSYEMDKRFIHKDGHAVYATISVVCLRNAEGSVHHFLTSYLDITERKIAEEQLNANYKLLRIAGETAKFGGWSYDLVNNIVTWSDIVYDIHEMPRSYSPNVEEGINFYAPEWKDKITRLFRNCSEKGIPYDEEMEIITKNGRRVWVRTTGEPVRDEQGKITKIVGAFQDISESKKAEEKLRESENRVRAIVEGTPNLFFYTQDSAARLTYISPSVEKITGHSIAEWLSSKDWFTTKNPINDLARKATRLHLNGKFTDEPILVEIEHANHNPILLEVYENPIIRDDKVVGLQGVAHDVTKRKKAEEELQEERDFNQTLIQASPAFFVAIGADGKTIMMNKSFLGALGYTLDEVVGTDYISRFVPECDRLKLSEIFRRLTEDNVSTFDENQVLAKDGRILTVEWYGRPIFKGTKFEYFICVGIDITERKIAENELRLSQEKFRHLFEYNNSGVAIYEAVNNGEDFIFREFNQAGERIEKVKKSQIIGKSVLEMFPAVRDFGLFEIMQKVWRTGEPAHLPVTFYKDDRIAGWRENYVFKLPSGEVVTIFDDITKQKQAEEEKHRSEQYFRLIWEHSVDGMRLTDENGIILMVNKAFCKIVDMPEETLNGQPFTVIYSMEDRNSALERYKKRFLEKTIETHFEKETILHNGNKVFLSLSDSFLEYIPGKKLLLTVMRDVTEERNRRIEQEQLRTQLLQSQKMEAIGNLAGGVAHDFNNLLTVIQGHAQILMLEKNEQDSDYHELKQIINASTKAANLTRQLLLFSRKQIMEFKPVDLNEIVSNLLKMIQRLIGENIQIETDFDKAPCYIEADEGNLEQVIVNLVVNARDAMPNGGTLIIQTEYLALRGEDCQSIRNSRPGEFVCLTISDTGHGIPPEMIEKIFDPFFTTKEAGKGTGLGLSVVYGIIKKHNGWINVYSEPGHGTVMKIYLPATKEIIEEKITQPVETITYTGHGEMILIVEDNTEVRKFTELVLRQNGYVTVSAATASQAMEIFLRDKGQINLVISDVILPDRNGVVLAEEMLREKPEVSVLLCSGYAEETLIQSIKANKKFHFLQKPYQVHNLLKEMRRILSESLTGRSL
jgi:PAS domain S-box-containing protein